jgi:predicted AlkP superfamily pyrophosphatase or phosphodiesterase
MIRRAFGIVALALALSLVRTATGVPAGAIRARSAAAPLVLLLSLDGFRADYLDWYKPSRLTEFFARGVRAEGLVPVFPSKTFPNHWTIVTGLYPEHHGVTGNRMLDSRDGARFAMGSPSEQQERWWGGEPIWLTLQRQGRRSATMFWPGSTVEVRGRRPDRWRRYDGSVSRRDRVEQVLAWLSLPERERPHFVTLYFSDVDDAGHWHGPKADPTRRAVAAVDGAFGQLIDGLAARGLLDAAHIVVVSDHGMAFTPAGNVIPLDRYVDLREVDVIEWSPVLAIAARDGNHERIYRALAGRHRALRVYRRAEVPERFHYRAHPHIAPVIGIAEEGWEIDRRAMTWARRLAGGRGQHGYDNQLQSMRGIFLARGPRIAEGRRVPVFDIVHVYEILCAIAGVTPAPNDGSRAEVREVFR